MLGQIGVSIDLPGVHPYWLRRNAEAHMLGERGVLLLVVLRGLWPSQYRPCGEGPFRECKQEPCILPTGWRNLREDPADAPIRGTVPKPAYQDDRVPCCRGFVALVEKAGGMGVRSWEGATYLHLHAGDRREGPVPVRPSRGARAPRAVG